VILAAHPLVEIPRCDLREAPRLVNVRLIVTSQRRESTNILSSSLKTVDYPDTEGVGRWSSA
jgi:hypothetical protein